MRQRVLASFWVSLFCVFALPQFARAQDCMTLSVSDLVETELAFFEIDNAEPGSLVVAVWGTRTGTTKFENDDLNLCATFGIAGVKSKTRVAGLALIDDDGHGAFFRIVPRGWVGTTVLFQAAQFGTCPDECVSNLVERTIQPR